MWRQRAADNLGFSRWDAKLLPRGACRPAVTYLLRVSSQTLNFGSHTYRRTSGHDPGNSRRRLNHRASDGRLRIAVGQLDPPIVAAKLTPTPAGRKAHGAYFAQQ